MSEQKLDEVLKAISDKSSTYDFGTSADVDILDIIGASGSLNIKYATASHDQQEKMRSEFRKDLTEARHMVEGRIPTVTAMDLRQVQEFGSGRHFNSQIRYATFSRGMRTMTLRFSFEDVMSGRSRPSTTASEVGPKAANTAVAEPNASVERVLAGTGVCAKCELRETKVCRDVIRVDEGGETKLYYLSPNDVDKKFHHNICVHPRKIKVTGPVREESGKRFITARTIEIEE